MLKKAMVSPIENLEEIKDKLIALIDSQEF